MGHRIVKMPNGKFAIFSSIVDNLIVVHATPQQLINYYVEKEREEITDRILKVTDALCHGEDPYYGPFNGFTWEATLEMIRRVHGETDWCLCGERGEHDCKLDDDGEET